MSRRSFTPRMIVLTALVAGPTALHAQSVRSTRPDDAHAKALVLRTKAVALYDQPKRFSEAARLHVQEANYRTARDVEGVEALAMAARLFKYANRLFDARMAMEQAADRALTIGDVVRAAHAYLDAAFVARSAGQQQEITRLVSKAHLLADSPLLSSTDRINIRKRIKNEPSLATAK